MDHGPAPLNQGSVEQGRLNSLDRSDLQELRAPPRPDGQMTRAGGLALSLLATPLNVHILQTLDEKPMPLLELRQAAGSPPQSTMRLYSRTLTELGIVDRQREATFGGSVEYRITPAGRDLLKVAGVLRNWLRL